MNSKNYYGRIGLFLAFFILSSVGISQTYTFTSAGVTGRTGPNQAQINTAYTATTLNGLVTINVQGIQEFVVPASGNYSIESFGASGGSHITMAGHGANVYGELSLTMGTTLYILVGQMGSQHATGSTSSDGGGGGTFITDGTNLLFAAGGGGGSAQNTNPSQDASTTQTVVSGAAGQFGSAGAGYSTDGIQFTWGPFNLVAQSFLNGGAGQEGGEAGGWPGTDYGDGGFGGGGSACSCSTGGGGGGGGYLGGGGGTDSPYKTGFGGSTYSIPAATGVTTSVLPGLGDGQLILTSLCNPTPSSLIPDLVSLPDFTEDCIGTPPDPTATNNCATIAGTPDVSFPITAVGTTVVTWTYNDGLNVVTQTQNVIISGVDITPPVVDNANLSNMSSQCEFTPPTPTATDICAGSIQGVADVTFPYSGQGLTVITWTYDDGNGNTTTQTQNITLNDVAAPSPNIANLTDYTGCGDATPPTATADDYCAGTINGVPDVTFPITAAGPTTVTWTYDDGNGNVSSQTQDVYVTTVNASVAANGTTITAGAAGAVYQWIDCNTGQAIPGETNQAYTATVTGDYAVIVTDQGCSDTSSCVNVDFTSIDEIIDNALSIYPNPTNNGVFSVDFEGSLDQILVTDALGRNLSLPINLITGNVDGSSLANGNYTVRVFTNEIIYTRQIVVVK